MRRKTFNHKLNNRFLTELSSYRALQQIVTGFTITEDCWPRTENKTELKPIKLQKYSYTKENAPRIQIWGKVQNLLTNFKHLVKGKQSTINDKTTIVNELEKAVNIQKPYAAGSNRYISYLEKLKFTE
jgi:hypothetical protein